VIVGRPTKFTESYKSADLIIKGVLFNCSARIEKNAAGNLEAKGNCTEVGLINYMMVVGIQVHDIIR